MARCREPYARGECLKLKLRQLDAYFIKRELRRQLGRFVKSEPFKTKPLGPFTDDDIEEREHDAVYHVPAETLADAHGLHFLCPACFTKGNEHSIIVLFTGKVPDDATPGPGRWNPQGTDIDDLTFVGPGSTSIQLLGGCRWHDHLINGEVGTHCDGDPDPAAPTPPSAEPSAPSAQSYGRDPRCIEKHVSNCGCTGDARNPIR